MSSTAEQHIRQALKALHSEIKTLENQLQDRRGQVAMLTRLVGGVEGAAKERKPVRKTRKKGGPTIEAAVLQAVQLSPTPITSGGIMAALEQMGVRGAKITVYGTISRLRKTGQLTPVAHSGRGDAYTTGSAPTAGASVSQKEGAGSKQKSAPKNKAAAGKSAPKKKAAKKSAPKKKAAAKKSGPKKKAARKKKARKK